MKQIKTYLITLAVLLITGLLITVFYSEAFVLFLINNHHSFLMNVFFINYTFLGDGVFALCLIILLHFWFNKKHMAKLTLLSFLLCGFIVQLIKNSTRLPGIKLYFEPGRYYNFIDDISIINTNSFPSGHTATAFALAAVFVLTLRNKKLHLPVLGAAVLVAYSRIYLTQQSLTDVIAGAFIGTLSTVVCYYLVNKKSAAVSLLKHVYKKQPDTVNTAELQPGY